VIACSDSGGVVLDEKGIDLELLKQLKEVERRRISEYAKVHKHAHYRPGGNIWEIPCQVALPCATQNELTGKDAAKLLNNGCIAVGEGANMPTTPEGVRTFLAANVAYGPGKAANAGGVATSALEMQQNASRDAWSFEYTEKKLAAIMSDIHRNCHETAEEFGMPGNYVIGANVAGFIKVAKAMVALGLV
jgi:glutamate dehydrogenase (NADP+)